MSSPAVADLAVRESATGLSADDLVTRIAGLLRAAHPLRVGSALRQAGEILTCVAPPERAAVLDRAIHLALAGDQGSPAVAGEPRSGISPGSR